MKLDGSFQAGLLFGMLINQVQQQLLAEQQKVIEAQQQIIALQQQVQEMTPKKPEEKEVRWHLVSGKVEDDIVATGDLPDLEAYQQWIIDFGKKHVKLYVVPVSKPTAKTIVPSEPKNAPMLSEAAAKPLETPAKSVDTPIPNEPTAEDENAPKQLALIQ